MCGYFHFSLYSSELLFTSWENRLQAVAEWVVAVIKTKPVTSVLPLHRLENEQLADKVLAKVTEVLRNYPFDFQGARIITGKEEGAYGWITINYLLGKFIKVINYLIAPMEWLPGGQCHCVSGNTWIACQSE